MNTKSKSSRSLSKNEGEFIYEQWAKYLTINLVDDDILNDFGPSSRNINHITAEKLRCVFSEGYRLAMLQILQYSKDLESTATLDGEKFVLEILRNQTNFINEKIEDSFLLNRTNAGDGFFLSQKQHQHLREIKDRDFLTW
jgi:hypothetical protein